MPQFFTKLTDESEVQILIHNWTQIAGKKVRPHLLEKLQGTSNNKSNIYRLTFNNNNFPSVIAKKSTRISIENESFIYNCILPQVPVTTPEVYGKVVENSGEFCWLFMNEVHGEQYNESNKSHLNLATKWLSIMHSETHLMNLQNSLPTVNTDRYKKYLINCQQNIRINFQNKAFTNTDRKLLLNLLIHLDIISERYSEIEIFSKTIPCCLVHGDFISKNVFVKKERNGHASLSVIDWEASGWGFAAEDIGGLNLSIYWKMIKARKFLKKNDLAYINKIGLLFRYIAWIEPTSMGLKNEWIRNTMNELMYYQQELMYTLKKLNWK